MPSNTRAAYLLSTAALAAFAAPAFAQDASTGLKFSGDARYEYNRRGSDTETTLFGDLRAEWRAPSSGAIGFSADLQIATIQSSGDFVDNEYTEVWGGAVVTTPYGELTLGRPRSVIDGLSLAPKLGGSELVDILFSLTSMTAEPFLNTFGIFSASPSIMGASFKGSLQALSYGVAVHKVETGIIERTLTEVALSYDLGATKLYAGTELLDTPFGRFTKTIGGVNYTQDNWQIGAEAIGLSGPAPSTSRLKLYGKYAVTPALSLGLQAERITDPTSVDAFGATADYTFASGAYAQLGTLSNDGVNRTSLAVGYRF